MANKTRKKLLSQGLQHTVSTFELNCLTSYRRTAKIGFDPICYGTAVTAQRQLERQRRNGIFEVGPMPRNSYGAYGILTEFS